MGKKIKVQGIFKSTDQVKNELIPVITGAGIRAAGVLAGVYGFQKLRDYMPASVKPMTGPIMAVVGILGEAYLENEYAAKACQGISAAGVFRFAIDTNPALKSMTGVSFASAPVKETLVRISGIDGDPQPQEPDYSAMVAAIDASMRGIGDVDVDDQVHQTISGTDTPII